MVVPLKGISTVPVVVESGGACYEERDFGFMLIVVVFYEISPFAELVYFIDYDDWLF